jgi:sugar phosphate isomerase/epimerase
MASTDRTPLKLAGFADEISPQLDEQIRVFKQLGLTHFELRGVSGRNVLDFDDDLRAEIRSKLADNGLGVASIGSPVGKVKITDDWQAHFERFKVAVDAAQYFGAPFIRIFSYFPAAGETHAELVAKHRDEVIRRMAAKADFVATNAPSVTLVHENEKDIYGEKGELCLDLMTAVDSPKLRSAFDFANFVQAGERPLDNWPKLKPYSVHIHVKDALLAGGKVVPAGQGDGQLAPILKDAYASGYRGWLSLEPHLAAHGQFSGFSGPELFETAVAALRKLAKEIDVPLAEA